MNTQFPITVEFKKIALTNKMTVLDSSGQVLAFAHQKMLKLKEQVLLFADIAKTQPIGELRADKVIDFSPTFTYTDQTGSAKLSIKRNGRRSILKADYDIMNAASQPVYKVSEASKWVKVLNALMAEVPIVGLFTGYFLNPKYNIANLAGELVAEIAKQPAFFESSYKIDLHKADDPNIELLPVACLAVISRERYRG